MEEKEKKKEGRADRKPNWQEVYATVDDIQQFLSERDPAVPVGARHAAL